MNSEIQFSIADEGFRQLVDASQLDLLARPYIDGTLWEMAAGRITFPLRLLLLFSTDTPNPVELTNWPEDELVRRHLQTAFSEQELKDSTTPNPAPSWKLPTCGRPESWLALRRPC